MSEKMRDEIVSELRHTAGKLINGEISDGDIAASLLSEAAELLASSPAQEPITTEPVAWRYQRKEWDALLWRYQTEALVNDDFETPSDWLIEPLYAIPAPPQPGREEIAKIVYDAFDFSPTMGTPHKPEWMPGGNSFMQDRARRAANAILNLIGEPK